MADYLFLMHDDGDDRADAWPPYLGRLEAAGVLRGGSAIGEGSCHRREGAARALTRVTGFLRLELASAAEAEQWLEGNPVYEAGGTVEIRLLPRDGE